jgi:hypothetical protein
LTSKFFSILRNKQLPGKASIVSVYSLIAFMIYSWTFITFFYKLSSWIYYLTFGEIAIIFAYAMVVDLFESTLLLAGLLISFLLLPIKLSEDDFKICGTWFSLSFLAIIMVYLIPVLKFKKMIPIAGKWLIIAIVIAATLTLIFSRFNATRRFAHLILDRMTVFLFFLTPLSVISLLILIIRFLF